MKLSGIHNDVLNLGFLPHRVVFQIQGAGFEKSRVDGQFVPGFEARVDVRELPGVNWSRLTYCAAT